VLRAGDFAERRESGETSQTALRKLIVIHLLCWCGNAIHAVYMHIWRDGNRFMINLLWRPDNGLLGFGGESERQITADTAANFAVPVTYRGWSHDDGRGWLASTGRWSVQC
jgi:hypothetical protein